MRKYFNIAIYVAIALMIAGATYPDYLDGALYFVSTAAGFVVTALAVMKYARSAKDRLAGEIFFGLTLTNLQDEVVNIALLICTRESKYDAADVHLMEYIFATLTIGISCYRYKKNKDVWRRALS